MLESQPQHTTGTTTSLPAVVGIDAVLLVVRQLLNNPPPSGASPSAAKQWCHDIDQLIIVAINTPHQEGQHQPLTQQSRVQSAVHAALMTSYTTMDLREEINR
jgi:hypothetical protein